MPKPILPIITDIHIKSSNTAEIMATFEQVIKEVTELGLKVVACLGDVFDSRQAQPLVSLKCFELILGMFEEAGLCLVCIPGNHDKTDYNSADSFLDPFKEHRAFILVKDYDVQRFGDWSFHFVPFFEKEIWFKYVENIPKNGENKILMTHQAFEGSINNDGSRVSNGIKPSDLKHFDMVISGHYHNRHKVGGNIYHIPSILCNNFGEDNEKGITIFCDDGSLGFVNTNFIDHHTVVLDMDNLTKDEVTGIKRDAMELMSKSNAALRFKFVGSPEKVNAVDKNEFTSIGVSVVKEHTVKLESMAKAENGKPVMRHTDTTILDAFDRFCKEEGFEDFEYGRKCIIKKLEENGKR